MIREGQEEGLIRRDVDGLSFGSCCRARWSIASPSECSKRRGSISWKMTAKSVIVFLNRVSPPGK